MLHSIGLRDEVTRPDRDDFVEIHEENADPKLKHLLEICKDCPFYGNYDPESVLHFPSTVFSVNGDETITVGKKLLDLQFANKDLGRNEAISDQDIMKIRQMYDCDENACKLSFDSGPS